MWLEIAASGSMAALTRHAGVGVALEHGAVAAHARALRVETIFQSDGRGPRLAFLLVQLFQRVDMPGATPLVRKEPTDFGALIFLPPLAVVLMVVAVGAFGG